MDSVHAGWGGQQSVGAAGAVLPSGQPEPAAAAGAGQPDRCSRHPEPLQASHHVLQEHTRFVSVLTSEPELMKWSFKMM